MSSISLSTKTLGKAAKKEIIKLLPTARTIKKVCCSFLIRDGKGNMLAHVNEGDFTNSRATLILVK